jgi:hypothetical protein
MRVSLWQGVIGGAMLLGACGGGGNDAPVVPALLTCATATVPLCTDAATATGVRAAIADADTRLRPSLSGAAAAAIGTELATFRTAVDGGAVSTARSSADRLRAAITTLRGTGTQTPDLATLDAITLALIRAQAALGVTPAQLDVQSSTTTLTH